MEPGFFVMLDLSFREWDSIETYVEMIMTTDNQKFFTVGSDISYMKAYHHGLCQISSRDFRFHGKISFRSGVMTF